MKKLLSMVTLLLLFVGVGWGEMKSSISQYGITWTFDKSYECGQFVNGDWWVKGPATVKSVSPAPYSDRNGSQVNPVPGKQGFDNRGYLSYHYQASVRVSFPLVLQVNQSLVSTISHPTGEVTDLRGVVCKGKVYPVQTAAVLTCLAAAAPAGTYRPPYIGNTKPLYNISQIKWDKLPTLDTVPGVPTDRAYYTRGMQRVWLDHLPDWSGNYLHPAENMLGYHREVYNFINSVAMLVMLDIPERESLAKQFIQIGIDHAYISMLGDGSSAQCMWQILFAGIMLDEPEIYNMFKEGRNKSIFKTTQRVYVGNGWSGAKVLFRNGGASHNYEHVHPSQWLDTNIFANSGGGCKEEAYRHCCNSAGWPSLALAAILMDAKDLWNYDPFFDYVERWMNEDLTEPNKVIEQHCGKSYGSGRTTGSPWRDFLWKFNRYASAPIVQPAAPVKNNTPGFILSANPLVKGTDLVISVVHSGMIQVIISDMNGTVVEHLAGENMLFWNTGQVNPGMYFISTDDGSYFSPVLVVDKK